MRDKAIESVHKFIRIGSRLGTHLLLEGDLGKLAASIGRAEEFAKLALSDLATEFRRDTRFRVLEELRPHLYHD